MVCHRRAGKTVACINELIGRAIYNTKHKPRYSYVGPFRNQTKKIAWEYLKDYTQGQTSKVSEADLSVRLAHNDADITLYGADNPDAFRGSYNDGVVVDEYGDQNPTVWTKNLLPTLADRRGWAIFIGTPKGKNHFYKTYQRALTDKNWYNFMLKASESGILPQEELELQRAEMTEDEYMQEFECSFEAAVLGTYYSKLITQLEDQGRIDAEAAEIDPDFPVKCVWDLGFTDSTAIWFWQDRPDGVAIVDYEEAHSQALPYYHDLLRSKGYRYSEIWLPHDARAKSLQTGRSTVEQVISYQWPGDPKVDIVPNLGMQHGIDAARLLLPKCWIHPRAMQGVEALRAYRRQWDEERKQFGNAPFHDWSSHGSDAFRYLSLVAAPRILRTVEPQIILPPKGIQLDPLFEQRESRLFRRQRI